MKILLIGGSGSGKSAYGEKLLASFPPPQYYLATMLPYGAEGEKRILRHRALRAEQHFITVERYRQIDRLKLPAGNGSLLLECLGNWVANELFEPQGAGEAAVDAVLRGIDSLCLQCPSLIVITNQVGSDGLPSSESTQRYMRVLGTCNRLLAARFDHVAEIVAGVPVWLKGALPCDPS